jgi:peptidoglycan/xylan/chitin deacetylase (PgdA/CDA1 family)
MATVLPIYMYHQVVAPEEMPFDAHLYVTTDALAAQVLQLKRAGFRFLTLSQAWKRIAAGGAEEPAVVLTFDDLYDNFYRHAWPMLRELQVPATAFAITRCIGPADEHPMIMPGLFSASEENLREMVDEGLEIGSHTATHRELTTLSDAELTQELSASRRRLEKILGVPVTTLCYPRGRFSPRVVRFVEAAGYTCACTTLRGTVQAPADRYALKRVRAGMERRGWRLAYTTGRLYDLLNRRRTRRERARFHASDLATGEAEDEPA